VSIFFRGMFTRGLRLMTRSPHLRPLAVLRPLPVAARWRLVSTAHGDASAEGKEADASPHEVDPKDLPHEQLLAEYLRVKELHTKAEEDAKAIKGRLAYALADIDNVRKISRKDVSNAREFALKDFGKDLLDVMDNCERALSIFPEECKAKGHAMSGIFVGLEMTANAMTKVFNKHGLVAIPVEPGETAFDPNLHDAIFQQPVPGLAPGIVFSVVKRGWTINGRVLRAAQVGVTSEEETP
jgi:molecular chaperone GrpE